MHLTDDVKIWAWGYMFLSSWIFHKHRDTGWDFFRRCFNCMHVSFVLWYYNKFIFDYIEQLNSPAVLHLEFFNSKNVFLKCLIKTCEIYILNTSLSNYI